MISANDLRIQGIKAIEKELKNKNEAIISYRGKPLYMVIDFDRYKKFIDSKKVINEITNINKG